MAEAKKTETLIYCLGTVGGYENPFIIREPEPYEDDDYTTKGYARYIEEAKTVDGFLQRVLKLFLESVSDIPMNPLALIDKLTKTDMQEYIQEMRKVWQTLYEEHVRSIKELLEYPKQAYLKTLEESSSSSSAKLPKLDAKAATGVNLGEDISIEFIYPPNRYMSSLRYFYEGLRKGFQHLKDKMGEVFVGALEESGGEGPPTNLKGFTLQKMTKLAKWKFYSKAFEYLVDDLENELNNLRLDLKDVQEKEDRLTDFLDYTKLGKETMYHHHLLLTMELSGVASEVSALAKKQMKKWKKISEILKSVLLTESEAFEAKVVQWQEDIWSQPQFQKPLKLLLNLPLKLPVEHKVSNASNTSMYDIEDLPEDSPEGSGKDKKIS